MNIVLKSRDESIDVLRSFAIIGIFLAHSLPGALLVQLRGFDVVLMVFLSAVCSSKFDKESFNYFDYFVKRVTRLVLPVWIFLVGYYIGVYVLYYLPPLSEIISSFTFMSDRYVWIIRILLILSLLSPFIALYINRISNFSVVGFAIIICSLCELVFSSSDNNIINLLFMTLPYGVVYIIGMRINKFSERQISAILSVCVFIFILLSCKYWYEYGRFVTTSEFKYPPRIFYLSYGLFMTLLLWVCRHAIVKVLKQINLSNTAQYIGRHTYWLYLWHIPFVDIVGDSYNPMIRFVIIFMSALFCVTLQDFLVCRFVKNIKIAAVFKG